jgi:hypothetical protein
LQQTTREYAMTWKKLRNGHCKITAQRGSFFGVLSLLHRQMTQP